VRVAVIGANGFIGSRLVEQWHLEGRADVVPIVRRPEAAAPVLRFELNCRVADALDEHELARALDGCDAVVHAAAGPRRLVTQSPACVARAAGRAGTGVVIYLSSMAIHGWHAAPGTDETSPLPRRHSLPYDRWKVLGEKALRRTCLETGTRFVILRPGIVYGPRSQWTAGFAQSVVQGSAYVVAGGRGVCNAIYVDNLVHAVGLALDRREALGETFLVSDDEAITWQMLYEPVCRALGRRWDTVADLEPRTPRRTSRERLRNSDRRLAAAGEAGLPPSPPLETSLLQTCDYRFPTTKARRVLGFEPQVPFDEACRGTVEWLGFAGFPVDASTQEAA
jgi:nucleoside-diphosphate-sugar epimerase